MKITNNELKKLLEQKAELVQEGRVLNVKIEDKAQPIVIQYMKDRGVEVDGEAQETYGKDKHYSMFKGSYLKLQEAFKDSSTQALQDIISKDLEEDLNQLKSLEMRVTKLNEKMSDIVRELLPSLKLKETEEITTIKLDGDQIDLEVVDVVERYKEQYLKNKEQS